MSSEHLDGVKPLTERELREFIALQDKLLVCYRVGKAPTGKTLDRMHALRERLRATPPPAAEADAPPLPSVGVVPGEVRALLMRLALVGGALIVRTGPPTTGPEATEQWWTDLRRLLLPAPPEPREEGAAPS